MEKELERIEQNENVSILLAVESGSRAYRIRRDQMHIGKHERKQKCFVVGT